MRLLDQPVAAGKDRSVPAVQVLAALNVSVGHAAKKARSLGMVLAMDGPNIPQSWLMPLRPMVRISPRFRVNTLPVADVLPQVLAEFSTEPNPGDPVEGRWTRLRITRTGDHYLCEKTRGPEPIEERSATVPTLESAKAFFGGGWVVKELFAKLDPARFPRWP